MAGRRERQKLERERRILRAAGRLFSARGYSRTSIEDIARASRLAVGTVYNYVASKAELLMEILQRETDELIALGTRIVEEPGDDPVAAVRSLLDLFLRTLSHHDRKLWRELFSAAIAEPSTVGVRVFENDVRLVTQLARLLEKLKQRGALDRQVDSTRAAMAFYSLAFTWSMAFLMSEQMTADQMREEIDAGAQLVARGLFISRAAGVENTAAAEQSP